MKYGSKNNKTSDTISREHSFNNRWRIYGVDPKTNKVKLISGQDTSYTSNDSNYNDFSFKIKGAVGYNNAVFIANDICKKWFSNNSLGIEARAMNLNDFFETLTQDGINIYYNSVRSGYRWRPGDLATARMGSSPRNYPALYSHEYGGIIEPGKSSIAGVDISDPYYTSPTTETTLQATNLQVTVTGTVPAGVWYDAEYFKSSKTPVVLNGGGASTEAPHGEQYDRIYFATRQVSAAEDTGNSALAGSISFGIVEAFCGISNTVSLKIASLYNTNYYIHTEDTQNIGHIRPVVDLDSTIEFTGSGNGTESNPWGIRKNNSDTNIYGQPDIN